MKAYVTPGIRRRLSAGWVILLATVGLACDQPISSNVRAEGQANARGTRQAVEFDLPAEYWTKDANGEFVITGFRLGLFQDGSSEPLSTRDIGRDAVIEAGRTGQISLTPRPPNGVGAVVWRLQTLTRDGASPWSAPTPAVDSAGSTPARPEAAAKSRRRPLSMSDVERHPRLLEAFRKALPSSAAADQVLAAFRNVNELSQAVAISTAEGMALDVLGKKMAGPPRQSLRNAVRELRPNLRGTDALRKANMAAKELLGAAPKQ
jgi:hypothetical protein